ncbi:hypothetical protein C8N44_1751, partial [Allosediminivita pacifica]
MDFSHLEKPPYGLGREDIDWVKRTWEALDDAERVGQLFNLRSVGFDTEEIAR